MKRASWNKWILSAIVVLIACTMLIGYGCSESNDKLVNLGFIGPLTGPAASYGVSQMRGVELAVEEINGAGGIEGGKIKVTFEDSQMDPNKAISAIKKLRNVDEITSSTYLKKWLYLRVSFEKQSVYSKSGNCFHQNIKKCKKS